MNSLILITVVLTIFFYFLVVKVDIISFILCKAIALLCVRIVKIFQKVNKPDDISSPSFDQNDQEQVRDDFVKAKNKRLCVDEYFKPSALRSLINCIVFPVLINMGPCARESSLVRRATFLKVPQEDIGQLNFSELTEAGFWYDESSSSVCCCRCTSRFKLKKIPEEKEKWHVPRCQFHVPAQICQSTARTELDEPQNAQDLQETSGISEDMNAGEQAGPPVPGSRPAQFLTTGQLVQPTGQSQQSASPGQQQQPASHGQPQQPASHGQPQQPASNGQPQQPAVSSNDPRKAYKTFEARENSITGKEWAVEPNTPRALAMNGLYYGGMGDRLCCISCPFFIIGWHEAGNLFDVKKAHAKYSPLCGAIRHRPSPP